MAVKFFIRIFVILILEIFIARPYAAPTINFPDFASVNGLSLLGDAKQNGKALGITDTSSGNQYGAAWYMTKQKVKNGFETQFQFQITRSLNHSPGDGFAFVIQNDTVDGTDAIGSSGANLGYAGILNGLVVEFDTWTNSNFSDPDNNHIGVMCSNKNIRAIIQDHWGNLGTASLSEPIFTDGKVHTVKISYDGSLLTINIDTVDILIAEAGMDSILGPTANGEAWLGFTGSTGSSIENSDILNWTFVPGATSIKKYSLKNEAYESNVWAHTTFSKSIRILYCLPIEQYVILKIFDSQGKNISKLHQGYQKAGFHQAIFSTGKLSTGVYYYQLQTEKISALKPILVK